MDEKKQVTPRDIIFVEVPAGGFAEQQIADFIHAGYSLWGEVNIVTSNSGILLPDGGELPRKHLVLKLDVNHVPVNLLAHQIVNARDSKGGLNQICRVFFGLTLGELADGLAKAKAGLNGR